MSEITDITPEWIRERKAALGLKNDADIYGGIKTLTQDKFSKSMNGTRQFKPAELVAIQRILSGPRPDTARLAPETTAPMARTIDLSDPLSGFGDRLPLRSRTNAQLALAFGEGHQKHAFEVRNDCLNLAGYLPGDFVMVDMTNPESAIEGDIVVAQVNTDDPATIMSVFRRFEPPFLVPVSSDRTHKTYSIRENSTIMGIAVASWRTKPAAP